MPADLKTKTAADAVVDSLIHHGIDTLFALPGAQIDHLFASLHDRQDAIRTITSRHEQGAAYMAFGAARSTGSPAVYSVVPGPGWLNASAALLTAYGCYAPVMCLAGQIPSASIGRDLGELHEVPDQLALAGGLTKWAQRVGDPDQASAQVARAFQAMTSGLQRPVHLELPPDVLGGEHATELTPPQPLDASPSPDFRDIERAADLLRTAQRPLLFVGGGAQHCGASILNLAEKLEAPVAAFRTGRGVIDSRHYLSQPWASAHGLWREADVVVAIGTRMDFPLRMWGSDSGLRVIWIDLDPDRPGKIIEPEVALIGDSAEVVTQLSDALDVGASFAPSRQKELEARKVAAEKELSDRMEPQMAFLRAIRSALPENGIFVDELTQVGYASWSWFPVYSPRSFVSSGYQGNLGYGFQTALGVKVANPDRPVVSIAGDGGFQFGAAELATAVKHDIGVVAIVFNDGWYGNVRRIQRERYQNRIYCSDLVNPDYQMLAQSYGISSSRVDSAGQLASEITRALATGGPALIEAKVGEMPTPWEAIIRTRNRNQQ